MSLHYSLDSIRVKERRLFGWGFGLDTTTPLIDGRLVVPLVDGSEHEVPLLPGGYREDLVLAYPAAAHAGGAGFMVQAVLPKAIRPGTARLEFRRPAGPLLSFELPRFPEAYSPPEAIPFRSVFHRFAQVRAERGLAAAMVSAFRGAFTRLQAVRRRRHLPPARVAKETTIVLDHGMGGGANRYREDRIESLIKAGLGVMLATPVATTLDYRITYWSGGRIHDASVDSLDALLDVLEGVDATSIEINDLVGFDDVPKVLRWLRRWDAAGVQRRIRFNLHDFHAACPAFTLVDAGGRFCRIPDFETCRRCLPANAHSTLGLDTQRDVAAWRSEWFDLLSRCTEIVAFSLSSRELLLRAHPRLDEALIRVQPHADAGQGMRRVSVEPRTPTIVAVVGHLNRAKGADLLRAIARIADQQQAPLRFVVFGTIESGPGEAKSLRVLGSYARESLAENLEAEDVGLAFLPSICPETYSYVADEIMATGLPLAVLDRGAPMERVARYPAGRILSGDDPAELLRQLVDFAASSGSAASTGQKQ